MSIKAPPPTTTTEGTLVDDVAFAGMVLVVYGAVHHFVDLPAVAVGVTLGVAGLVGKVVDVVRDRRG